MRFRLLALLILPTAALVVLASVVIIDRNTNYDSARTGSDVAALAASVARVDQALGDESLKAAQLAGANTGRSSNDAVVQDRFLDAAATTDAELALLTELIDSRSFDRELGVAAATIEATLAYRHDIDSQRMSPLQVNDRYAYIRNQLLQALSHQATVVVDAEGQQQIVALIALIESRSSHLDERLVVTLALTYQTWAPGQHSAAISAAARHEEQLGFANNYFEGSALAPSGALTNWRTEIATNDEIPPLTVDEWESLSDNWLSALNINISNHQRRIATSLTQAEASAATERTATLLGVLTVVALALGLTSAVAYRLVRRMSIITDQAGRMAEGSSAQRTYPSVGGDDELGVLARAFDEMITQVEQRTKHQWIESTALEAIANRSPLDKTLDRIALLLGTDEADNPLYRFHVPAGDRRGPVEIVDAEGRPVDPSRFDSVEARTALGLVATARQRADDHEQLEYQANHDDLTGLLNRGAIIDRVAEYVGAGAGGRAGPASQPAGLLYADLDVFKDVNDKYGHAAGDRVLIEQSRRLLAALSPHGGSVGRFGGDEFLAIVPELDSIETLRAIADQVVAVLSEPIQYRKTALEVGVSLGAALGRPGVDAVQLLHDADSALYEAKRLGRGVAVVSTLELRDQAKQHDRLRHDVAIAFERNQFVAWYQPVWAADGTQLVGLEALVRWEHPRRGIVLPGEFLPVVADMRLLAELDARIFQQVCDQSARWLAAGMELQQVHVNVSTERLEDHDFIGGVGGALASSGCPPSLMVAEVTESGLMTDTTSNSNLLARLRDLGVRVAVDDFGQGYSSLAYLSDLPIDILKIDRSFVDRIDQRPDNQAIVSAVIDMSHKLGLSVVSEGIEREQELTYLVAAGCELFQGYLLGRPMPTAETTALLDRMSHGSSDPSGQSADARAGELAGR